MYLQLQRYPEHHQPQAGVHQPQTLLIKAKRHAVEYFHKQQYTIQWLIAIRDYCNILPTGSVVSLFVYSNPLFMLTHPRSHLTLACLVLSFWLLSGCHPYFDEILKDLGQDGQDLPETVTITEAGLFPEGVEYDSEGHRFLVSSLTRGTIGAVDDQGNYEAFIEDDDFGATIGIEIDEARQRLLVCVSDPSTAGLAALGSYDLHTGERQFFTDLIAVAGDDAPHFANDVAVDRHGNAYVTDSFSPIVYKVDPQGEASVFLQDSTFQASPGAFGLNGVVYLPNESLIVGFSETATLYTIPLDNPDHFRAVDAEDGSVTSPDGLYLSDNDKTLIVVNNDGGGDQGKVVALQSNDQWESAHARGSFATGPVFPTTAAQRGNSVYVLYAHLNELFSGNPSRDTFEIVRVDFDEND